MSAHESSRKALRPAPLGSLGQAQRLVYSLFRVHASSITELDSYDDRNFLVTTTTTTAADSHRYVLKIHNGADGSELPMAQTDALRLLSSANIACPVDDHSGAQLQDHFVRLLRYLPGTLLADHVSKTDELYFALGRFLARVDLALAGLERAHPVLATRQLQWDLRHFSQLAYFVDEKNNSALTTEQRAACVQVLDEYAASSSSSSFASFQRAVVHNDANDRNLLVLPSSDGVQFGIIDFGDMVHTWLVSEVAIAMAYVVVGWFTDHDNDDDDDDDSAWLGRCGQLLSGYTLVTSLLSSPELDALYLLVRCRIVTSASLGAYSAMLSPDNQAYLLVHSQPAWRSLEALNRVGKTRFDSSIMLV